jgi:serine/threonine protein phosphatase PrpC
MSAYEPYGGFGFTIWTEKEEDAGEDSPPLLQQLGDTVLVGVFDGLGGAGGRRYQLGSVQRTGAYLASRAAARSVQRLFLRGDLQPDPDSDYVRLLESTLKADLQTAAKSVGASGSRVKSRMSRELPTTMAVATTYREHSDTTTRPAVTRVWWAGDSRVYVLDPVSGLAQLTTDHVAGGVDAMANLVADSSLENCLAADRDFHIDTAEYRLRVPHILLAATDGCFGYLPSPMHFEHLLLRGLVRSSNPAVWAEDLTQAISRVTGDDAAMSILAVGSGFDELQQLFRKRFEDIEVRSVVRIDNAIHDVACSREILANRERDYQKVLESTWAMYKTEYEQFMPEGSRADPSHEANLPEVEEAQNEAW